MLNFMDELEYADNVYRTDEFIVVQDISLRCSEFECPTMVSRDVYFARTRERDAIYEQAFKDRSILDGHRVKVNMYSRKYVD